RMTVSLPSRSRKKAKPVAPLGGAPVPPHFDDDEEHYKPIEWRLIQRMLTWLRPYKWLYALELVLAAAHVLLEMLSPRFMQHIVNYVTAYLAGDAAAAGTNEQGAVRHVVLVVGLWACVYLASLTLLHFVILIAMRAGERVQFDLRRAIFSHLQRLSMSYYDRTKLGRIISRCTSDLSSLREINVWGINHVVLNSLMMAVAAIMLLRTDWRLFLSVAWLAPVLVLVNHYYRTKAGTMHQLAREGYSRVSTNLAENITGMRVVTAFNRQTTNLGTFNILQVDNTANNVRVARFNGLYQPTLTLIAFVGKVIILTYGAYLVVSGKLGRNGENGGVGAVVAAFLYWDWFMNPIINFGVFYNQLMAAMAGAERVFDLLDTKPELTDHPTAKPLPRVVGHVRFENVTFGYNPQRPVLHDVSFEALPGQTVALVGATGSGKSSIVSLIARFYQPQRGRVLVDGQDIRYVASESLHRQTGLVLQVNYLFTGTVMENIRYAKPEAAEDDVIRAAQAIGSYDSIMSLQNGFQSEVGERGAGMSLGQRQLICFTRAFVSDPRIFMLDEATSSVDTSTELQIQHSLEKLLQGRTTFVVAHRLSTIMRADQILVIDAGHIVERGRHAELLSAGGRYARLYEQFVRHSE
ncbi:MAG: ABC transporter ATP-binding protein, partial [Tepidisphaeraceae bacterium]